MDEFWNDAITGFTRGPVIKCAESEKRDRMGSVGRCKVCKCDECNSRPSDWGAPTEYME